MPHLHGFTKTSKYRLITPPNIDNQLLCTIKLYNIAVSYYLQVFQDYPKILGQGQWLRIAEILTHRTKFNPNPVYPLDTVLPNLPSGLRRAAISEAYGLALAWQSSYDNWQNKKACRKEKNKKRVAKGKKPIVFTDRPPQYPEKSNAWPVYYGTEHKWLDENHIMLKLYTGKAYVYRKIALAEPFIVPNGYAAGSPSLVHKPTGWELHIPLVLQRKVGLKKITTLVKNPGLKLCVVDLGITRHATITIQDTEGRVCAAKFISGRRDNRLRKRYLEKIVKLQKKTRIIPEGERFAKHLWDKVSNLNDDIAHRVSKQIVEFARHHGARIIVFEHLGNLKPEKGIKSRRLNQKLGYWVKGRIFRYSQYKALHQGIITSRVNPKNTSKRCPYCGMLTIERYNPGNRCEAGNDLAWCTNCNTHDINADFIGTLGIGLNFRLRYCS